MRVKERDAVAEAVAAPSSSRMAFVSKAGQLP
jgi:hypothetical protein